MQVVRSKWRRFATVTAVLLTVAVAGGVQARGDALGGLLGQFFGSAEYSSSQHRTGFASCNSVFPGGIPFELDSLPARFKPVGLCSNTFAVVHSGLTKTPLIVFERLNAAQLRDALHEERTHDFFPDPRLGPSTRAELEDYPRSGLDRGHLAAAGQQPDSQSMAQSFALSNIIPQDPTNNRTAWRKIESDVRKFVRRAKGDVYVVTGPLFLADHPRKIGRGQVWVPSHLFKLVFDEANDRAWAYILANSAHARIERPMSYREFVSRTGWNLLPHEPRS